MEAFEAGAGIGADALYWLIAGAGCAVMLLVVGWILLSAYRGFVKSRVDGDIFSVVGWKSLILILVFFWLLL